METLTQLDFLIIEPENTLRSCDIQTPYYPLESTQASALNSLLEKAGFSPPIPIHYFTTTASFAGLAQLQLTGPALFLEQVIQPALNRLHHTAACLQQEEALFQEMGLQYTPPLARDWGQTTAYVEWLEPQHIEGIFHVHT